MVNEGIGFLWQEYLDTLGRVPDPEGLAAWLNGLLFQGLTRDQVHQAFLASDEYRAKHPPIPPEPPKPPVTARRGIVRADGRAWLDETGAFWPLGGTLFWAVRGMKFEPARLDGNLAWFRDHRFDFIRVLGEVGWKGNEIDPRWPDYQDTLAKLIDLAYDQHGLRVELTLVGGGIGPNPDGKPYDYMHLADQVVAVVRDRQPKVIGLEVTNEDQIRDAAKRTQILKHLRAKLPNILVAATDSRNAGLGEVDGTAAFFEDGATYGTLHLDRDCGKVERAIRPIRQSWDFKGFGKALSANEPIGPLSSVAQDGDPMRLAFNRAVCILNGIGAWVLHNGAGVYGRPNTTSTGSRPANVWETPGIDQVAKAVRGVDQWLPRGLSNWPHFNHGWNGEPTTADSIWIDGKDHGVVRNYQARSGDQWVAFPLGIRGYVDLRVNQASDVQVIDLGAGEVVTRKTVGAGDTIRLKPHGRPGYDPDNRDTWGNPDTWDCQLVTGTVK